jgi:hypothetical protein
MALEDVAGTAAIVRAGSAGAATASAGRGVRRGEGGRRRRRTAARSCRGDITEPLAIREESELEAARRPRVTIWPDADEAGAKYAETVAAQLVPIAASVKRLIPPAGVKVGWDAADALGEGWDQARAAFFVGGAA